MDGIVKVFGTRGFGFITPLVGKPGAVDDVFVHARNCEGERPLPVGARVSFDLVRAARGVQAANVRVLKVTTRALVRASAAITLKEGLRL